MCSKGSCRKLPTQFEALLWKVNMADCVHIPFWKNPRNLSTGDKKSRILC